jgi:hypothetical protein
MGAAEAARMGWNFTMEIRDFFWDFLGFHGIFWDFTDHNII